jgi:diaminopimelate epimerase
MVNSHCVVFVNNEVVFALEDSEFTRVGRQFGHHPLFSRRVNTEFILPFSRDRLQMRVWERARVRHRPAARESAPRWSARC